MIEALRELAPAGIELSFSQPEYLFDFECNENNLEYLRSLKFNSIHAPWKDIIYGRNEAGEAALQKIESLYKQINARNVVFHREQIEDYDSILNKGFVAWFNKFTILSEAEGSIENEDWRKTNCGPENTRDILNKYEGLKFTFDFAHALSVSPSEALEYMHSFKDRLFEIHLSVIDKASEQHDFLYKYDSPGLKALLSPLKAVSVPVVLEAVVSNSGELALLKKEMEYINKI